MSATERLRALRERLRSSLWFLPTVAVVSAVVLALVMVRMEVPDEGLLTQIIFGAGVEGARSVLQVVTGSVMTVVSVTFSLTVVALVNASNQYSPRVLSTFLRDRAPQVVLSTFLATFAYGIVVLRTIPSVADQANASGNVPRLAVTATVLLAFASLAAFVYFIHHITQAIRVESILNGVCRDTLKAMSGLTPPDAVTTIEPGEAPPTAITVKARESGYVQGFLPRHVTKAASDTDAVVRFRHRTGSHVTAGTTLAWAWPNGSTFDADAIDAAANASVVVGGGRTLEQDVAFGVRQLADIALRALSPGVNDPTTAADAIGRISVVLARLAEEHLGWWTFADERGAVRAIVPARKFGEYLELVVPQILLYGAQDPTAMCALVELLHDAAETSSDPRDLATIRRHLRACSSAAAQHMEGEAARRMVATALAPALAAVDAVPWSPAGSRGRSPDG